MGDILTSKVEDSDIVQPTQKYVEVHKRTAQNLRFYVTVASAIISFDGWYQYVRQMCSGIPMDIKVKAVDNVEFLETGKVKTIDMKEKVNEYSFLDDDIIEMKRLVDPMIIIPQDGLRYSIINLLTFCMGKLVNDYMAKYCDNSHTTNERECLITMKNEFLN